ncbi:hypothetical protein C8Q74DRAFT_1366863 [Fomes fomentarius]|nr:hypothetical protein C8Q74DRAFT_1366863 [Fomes fomentarius]
MHTPEQQKTQLARVLCALELRSLSALTAIRQDYLVAVAELNSVVERKTKAVKVQLAELLLTWSEPLTDIASFVCIPEALPAPTSHYQLPNPEEDRVAKYMLFTGEVLLKVRQDIAD